MAFETELTNELLPCPFCGSEAELQWESTQGFVSCTNEECYATSTWFSSDNASEVREYVTPKWNRRAGPQPMPESVRETIAAALEGERNHIWDYQNGWKRESETYKRLDSEVKGIDAALKWLESQPKGEG